MIRYLPYIFVFTILLSCQSKKDKTSLNTSAEFKNKGIYIFGSSDDSQFLQSLNFINNIDFRTKTHNNKTSETEGDQIAFFLKGIQEPQLISVMGFSKKKMHYTKIFVTPGDSIQFEFKNEKLKFLHFKPVSHNFFLEMDRNHDQWLKTGYKRYDGGIERYKKRCDSLYNSRLTFSKNYFKKHDHLSSNFKKAILDELRYEHLYNLISPRTTPYQNFYLNTSQDLIPLIQKIDSEKEGFFEIDKYLGSLSLDEFNRPEQLNNYFYKTSLIPIIRQYFVNSKELPYSKEAFEEEYQFIKDKLHKEVASFAAAKLIFDYHENGFGKDQSTAPFVKEVIIDYKKEFNNEKYLEPILDIENELQGISKILLKDLQENILTLSKDSINIFYSLQKEKLKVIDFWATWCQPCVQEIIEGKSKRDHLEKKYNLEFVFLSIDSDTENWIDFSVRMSDYLSYQHQYKILDYKRSKLIDELNIKASYGLSIPRYVILGPNNKIISNNAPKPSDIKFEDLIRNAHK